MSRRRPGGVDDLEIVFEGFERAGATEAADVSFGHGPFGQHPGRGRGRRWPLAIAAVGAIGAGVLFLATRDDRTPSDVAGRDETSTTSRPPSSTSASPVTSGPATSTADGPRAATIVTSTVDGAPLLGGAAGYTLHFTDQGASATFALALDTGVLREVQVGAGISQAVVTPGRLVGLTYDGRLAIVGNDGRVEVGTPAVGVVAVGDGSIWVAVPDRGRLRLNHLIPASDLVTESRVTPGPSLALAGSDAAGNPVVLGADGHPYSVTGDATAEILSSGSMASHAFGAGNQVVAGAYGDMACSVHMVCADVFHSADGRVLQLEATDPAARAYSFAPDGKRVAVVDLGAHAVDVYDFSAHPPFVLDVGTAGAAQVPTWSPDGRYVFTYVNRAVHWAEVATGNTGSFQLSRPGVAFVLVGVE
jgi:hypothetical protein